MKSCHDLTVDMRVSQRNLCADAELEPPASGVESIGKLDGVVANGKTTILRGRKLVQTRAEFRVAYEKRW